MNKRKAVKPETFEMDPETEARVDAMIAQADQDVDRMHAEGRWGPEEGSIPASVTIPHRGEIRINMRWGKAQVDVIRRAAALFGMPYQTYVKHAAFRQALDDLERAEAATKRPAP